MKTDNTISLMSRTKELANNIIISELKKIGITNIVPSHGDIIVTLMRYDQLTMTEIAKKINRDRSTVTTLVKKLNKIGVTETKKNEEDQRSSLVFLTTKGKELEKEIQKISEELYSIQFQGITEDDKEVFRKVLMQMYENFTQTNM